VLVVRHPIGRGAAPPEKVRLRLSSTPANGSHEHPTQALLDALTIAAARARLGAHGSDLRRRAAYPCCALEYRALDVYGRAGASRQRRATLCRRRSTLCVEVFTTWRPTQGCLHRHDAAGAGRSHALSFVPSTRNTFIFFGSITTSSNSRNCRRADHDPGPDEPRCRDRLVGRRRHQPPPDRIQVRRRVRRCSWRVPNSRRPAQQPAVLCSERARRLIRMPRSSIPTSGSMRRAISDQGDRLAAIGRACRSGFARIPRSSTLFGCSRTGARHMRRALR